jgi:molybdate transport system regulatory protein
MPKSKKPASDPTDSAWKPGVRCWIECGGRIVMGKGRADLLEHIGRAQSIRGAAKEMGMSYRRAWLLVQSANDHAGEPLVTKTTGGKGGGGAILTPKGLQLLKAYRQLEKQLQENAAQSLASFIEGDSRKRA